MKTLTLAEARALLAEIVKGKGAEYVYDRPDNGNFGPACVYAERGEDGKATPSCLVGHLFLKILPEHAEAFAYGDGTEPPGSFSTKTASSVLEDLERSEILATDNKVRAYLDLAQRAQDYGRSWGESFKGAERYADKHHSNDSE